MVGVFSLATCSLLDLAIAPWSGKGTGEHTLLRQLMHLFEAGDIALGDAYYCSFFLISALLKKGVDVVFPIHGGRNNDFRRGKRLSKGDHLVEWARPVRPSWMTKEEYAEYPRSITVRETKIISGKPGFRSKSHIIVTTMTDQADVSPNDLGELYGHRWFAELNFRSVKEIMRMDILRGKTPEIVRKEIWAHVLAYNLIRKMMAQAAIIYRRNPREMSFKLALQMVSAFRQAGVLSEKKDHAFSCFLRAIAYKKTGTQIREDEPRVVKRRPKAFPRMQKARHFYKKGDNCHGLS
jgi:hypothetical protein